LTIGALILLADSPAASAKEQCPAGPTDFKSLLDRRVPVRFGKKPVRINPDGACEITWWIRHCIYVRQAGETKTLGPFCPAGEPSMKGAIIMGPRYEFPPDVEWAWSAVQPFTAYISLSPLSQGHVRFSDTPPPAPMPGNAMIDCELADGAKVRTTSSACDGMKLTSALEAMSHSDFANAARLAKPLAEGGERIAQRMLGQLYANGTGVPRNPAEAVRWYQKAADQNLPAAEEALGIAYETGTGIGKNLAQAAFWYGRAADQGMRQAQANLGWLYATGQGLPRDPTLAAKYLRLAAERGSSEAQHNLAHLLEAGDGIAKDEAEAFKWYWRAADHGRAQSMNNLGLMYANGRGTERDLTQAYLWLTLAVKMLPAGAEKKAASKNLAMTAVLCKKEQIEEAERLVALFEPKPAE
jgi:hypothetical protein